MLAQEGSGSWGLASYFHIFCSLDGLDPPRLCGLARGRGDGAQPRHPPQRIVACSGNGCDFSICFSFPGCRRTFDSSNDCRHGMAVRLFGPGTRVTHATTNGLVIAMSIGTVLLAFATMSAVSIIGFFEGWLLGWRCARGEHFRDVVKRGPTVRLLWRLGFRKLHRAS
jgi:hypothetical protein